MMTTIPKSFEHPLIIGDTDWLVRVTIDGYSPAGGDDWTEPRYPADVQYSLTEIRRDMNGSAAWPIDPTFAAILYNCADWRQACLDAIADANEPYEDNDGQPDEAQEWADFDPDC